MDFIVLDTETTGLNPRADRIIEIGAIRIQNRVVTDDHFHYYLNPDCAIHQSAVAVHGITEEFLKDKPRFEDIAPSFLDWVQGATLIIHNAPFDTGFLNAELMRLELLTLQEYVGGIIDTLSMARQRFRGKKNDLNSLLERFGVDSRERVLHGALLDARLLATLYLRMTEKQEEINFDTLDTRQSQLSLPALGSLDQASRSLDFSWLLKEN